MPNHVNGTIIPRSKEGLEKLKELLKDNESICDAILPIPKELVGTTSPCDPNEKLIKKYGASNWYEWSINAYGTKWGDYEPSFGEDFYRFETAWGPLSDNFLTLLQTVIGSFSYDYEEEQGWGAMVFVGQSGEVEILEEWDCPEWEEIEESDEIIYLTEDYSSFGDFYKKGYYLDWNLNEFISSDKNEAIKLNKE